MASIYDSCARCDGRIDPYGRQGVHCDACSAAIVSELARAKVAFQLRAIETVIRGQAK